jgi:hypothetical protein
MLITAPSDKLNVERAKTLATRIKKAYDITKQKFYSAQKHRETTTNKYQHPIDFGINDFI